MPTDYRARLATVKRFDFSANGLLAAHRPHARMARARRAGGAVVDDKEAGLLRSQTVTLETGRGRHRKYRPSTFTEQGVAMLSSVLRSGRHREREALG
jgi:hypothetical protein